MSTTNTAAAALENAARLFAGEVACPDCGDEGPHDTYSYMGEREFCCSECGMQHSLTLND